LTTREDLHLLLLLLDRQPRSSLHRRHRLQNSPEVCSSFCALALYFHRWICAECETEQTHVQERLHQQEGHLQPRSQRRLVSFVIRMSFVCVGVYCVFCMLLLFVFQFKTCSSLTSVLVVQGRHLLLLRSSQFQVLLLFASVRAGCVCCLLDPSASELSYIVIFCCVIDRMPSRIALSCEERGYCVLSLFIDECLCVVLSFVCEFSMRFILFRTTTTTCREASWR
jgi:hypothetical protein